ncbi:MAG: hypothetical protein M3Y49_09535 [Actinomycetota bacterium]|nr:hypothetical protein [Actinomycetota bacterium]
MSDYARFSTQAPRALLDRVRAAVAGLQEQDPEWSLSRFVTQALARHVRHLEEQHHGGVPWPAVTTLRKGTRPRPRRDNDFDDGSQGDVSGRG